LISNLNALENVEFALLLGRKVTNASERARDEMNEGKAGCAKA